MKKLSFNSMRALLAGLFTVVSLAAQAQPTLVSTINSALPSATAGGDSISPIISRDGRYVLYSSTANNLVTNASGGAFQAIYPSKMNVYVYDRTNGTTTLVSANLNGTGGGSGDSFATAISTNGQYALFESTATNLVAGDTNGVSGVFVRDIVHSLTTLVSVGTTGGPGNDVSRSSTMTPDGRYVAFVSAATNLVALDTNGIPDVFVRDLVGSNTVLVSVGAMAPAFSLNSSESPDITPDGRYVAFSSTATNLLPGLTISGGVYVRDLIGGVTIMASTNALAIYQSVYGSTSAISHGNIISDDGQYVAFETTSTTVVSGTVAGVAFRYHVLTGVTDTINTNTCGYQHGSEGDCINLDMTPDGRFVAFVTNINVSMAVNAVCLWDGQFNTTTLVSGNTNNAVPSVSDCYSPQMSADGRYVAFYSSAPGLTPNPTISGYHLYVRDTQAGVTTLADPRTNGTAPSWISMSPPSLSTNGQFVAFESIDPGLVTNDGNRAYDVFLRDLTVSNVQLISGGQMTLPSVTPFGPSLLSVYSVSTNARYVVFTSEAEDLVTNDTNFTRDVFVRDTLLGSNILVSVGMDGNSGNNLSSDCAISGNGRYVAFTSFASNLVAGDNNTARDVFLRDLQAGTTTLISINTSSNGPGNADSYSPTISADGRYVLFHSRASNLAPGFSSTTYENLFWRDTQAGITVALFTNINAVPIISTMTTNGRFVAYGGTTGLTTYVWDMQTRTRIYTNTSFVPYGLALSQDGTLFALTAATNNQSPIAANVFFVNLTTHTNRTLSGSAITSHVTPQFSANGRYLVYAAGGYSQINQVVLFDSQAGTTNLISKSYNSSGGGNASSDEATISPDGRFIAYRSAATNIVPGDANGEPDIFIFDQTSGDTTMLNASQYGNFSADNRALLPVFSSDSQTLLFTSWASDIISQNFNQSGNVLAYSLYNSNTPPSLVVTVISPGTITWPVVAGMSYQAQFKNNLTDAMWQVVNGNVTIVGNQGYVTDLTPAPTQKFYRIMAY